MNYTQYTLENGMNVILQPQKTAPVVACNVWVAVGSADETPREAGLAHVHEHMLFKGTENRGVGEVAREIEASGGYMNAFTSFDQTCYYVVMSSRFFERGVDILADVVQRSSFEAEELAKELEVIQEEIKRGNDDPQRVASQLLFETAYTTHPYRLPIIGTKASVDSFERSDVQEFFRKHYVPQNMTLVLAGDFEVEHAKSLVGTYFSSNEPSERVVAPRETEPTQSTARAAITTQEINEAHLRVGFHIPSIDHDDIPALDVLGVAIGYGEASTLYQNVVKRKRLANHASSGAYTPKDSGLFIVAADYQLGDQSHEDVLGAVLSETFSAAHRRVSPEDLRRAKNILESQEVFGRQTIEGTAMKLGRSYIVTGDASFEQAYNSKVAAVSSDDLLRVAKQYLTPENCSVALVCKETTTTTESLLGSITSAFESAQTRAVARPQQTGGIAHFSEGGKTIVVQQDSSVETFAIRALTHGGLRYEAAAQNGLSALAAELLTQGTSTQSALEIALTSETCATSLGGISGRNSIGLGMSGLSKHYDPMRSLFLSCAVDASFPEDEFEHAKQMQEQAILARQDRLGAVTFDRFATAYFGAHPYARPTTGTLESVRSFTSQSAREFKDALFQSSQWSISVVGDVDPAETIEFFKTQFPFGAVPSEQQSFETPTDRPRWAIGDLDREQAFVTVGFDAPTMSDDTRYAMEVVHTILSGQGGRLFLELRDKQSLAYSVYVSVMMGLDASAFMVNIGTSPEKVETAIRGMIGEVTKLAEGVTDQEIDRAKTYLIGANDIGLQRHSSRAMSYALDELYGFGHQRTFEYGDRIQEVTRSDIQDFVVRFLTPSRCTVAITKPESVDINTDSLESLF